MSQKKIFALVGSLMICILLVSSACSLFGGQGTGTDQGDTPPELPEDADPLINLAKLDLTLRIGVDFEKIETISVEKVDFSDASLGVPQPGVEYAQVVTPGYIILLSAEGETYQYHASGEMVIQAPEVQEADE
jgi:hypothetical protein